MQSIICTISDKGCILTQCRQLCERLASSKRTWSSLDSPETSARIVSGTVGGEGATVEDRSVSEKKHTPPGKGIREKVCFCGTKWGAG